MATATSRGRVCGDELARRKQPRNDFVKERVDQQSAGQVDFTLAHGPFKTYRRTLSYSEASAEMFDIVDRCEFELATPVWKPLLTPLVWYELRRSRRRDSMPWWAPPERFDATSAQAVSYLVLLVVISGYLGSLLSQTLAFAGREFGAAESSQSSLAALVRLGVPIAFLMGSYADRAGRRRALLVAATAGCILSSLTALAPSFLGYGIAQAIARGMSAGLGLLVGVAAAEETPDGSRAYIASILTMAAGLGAGMVVWLVPLTELDVSAWRILFLVPLLALAPLWWMRRGLPETRRFALHVGTSQRGPESTRLFGKRFVLLAGAFFLLSVYAAPASTLHGTFLLDERGYSGSEIAAFRIVTSTPVGIGLLIAGRLADTRGRRVIGAVGLTAGTVFSVAQFIDSGLRMWLWALLGTIIGAAAVPALGVYGPEMFSTRSRSRANGALIVVATTGSAVGLLAAAWALDYYSFGVTFAVLAIAPLSVAVLLTRLFPETAAKSLEELNPQDDSATPWSSQ